MKLLSTSLFAAATLASTTVRAETGPQTVLPNIQDTGDGATLEARVDYTNIEDSDLTLFGVTLHGQYITPGGLGVYGTLPYSYAGGDDDSVSGIGNFELGALYVNHNSPTLDIFGRAGLSLDTADNEDAFLGPVAFIVPRPNDAITTGFDTNWIRLHGGIRTKGAIVFGAQGGFDLPTDGGDLDGIFSLAGSVGFVQPGFGLSAGLTYLKVLEDSDDGLTTGDDDTIGFNATVDFNVGPKAKVFGSLGLNLDDIDEQLGFSLGGGVRIGL